jgi:hypothetical protein
MLDDVAFELREDKQFYLAAEVFAFDYANADSTDLYQLQRKLEGISRWAVGDAPGVLDALGDLYDAFVGLDMLFYLVRDGGEVSQLSA